MKRRATTRVKASAPTWSELRRLLKERAIRRVAIDRQVAAEWGPLADDVWRKLDRMK